MTTREIEDQMCARETNYLKLQVELGILTELLHSHQRASIKREADLMRLLATNCEKRAEILKAYDDKQKELDEKPSSET